MRREREKYISVYLQYLPLSIITFPYQMIFTKRGHGVSFIPSFKSHPLHNPGAEEISEINFNYYKNLSPLDTIPRSRNSVDLINAPFSRVHGEVEIGE